MAGTQNIRDKPEEMDRLRLKMDRDVPGFSDKIKRYMTLLVEIREYNLEWAEFALATDRVTFEGDGESPIERVEVKEFDGKKHGNTEWMLFWRFDYRREDGRMRRNKEYVVLNPDSGRFDAIRMKRKKS